jgi:hypothetical protein
VNDPFSVVEPKQPIEIGMRTWTDSTGTFEIVGRVHDISVGSVRLLKENGRFTTVPMHRLSAADQDYVDQVVADYGRGEVAELAAR